MAVISTCSSNSCQFCPRGSLDTTLEFTSSCSNKVYNVDFNATCTTANCIYLISCKCCKMKYVGKTINSIRCRHNGHRGNIRNGTEAFVMKDHLLGKNGHGLSNMIIKPIELCTKENINKREQFWIAELNTVFPYGLNIDAKFKGIKNAYTHVNSPKVGTPIYSVFKQTDE